MKKRKPPRAKVNATQPSPPAQPPTPFRPQPLQVLETWWGKLLAIFAVLGALQTPFNIYDLFRSIYADTSPEISVSADDANPFVLPFRIKNNSHFFPMTSVTWVCGVDDLRSPVGSGISGIGVRTDQPPVIIWPTRDATFRCPIGADKSISAVINPAVHYQILWWFDRVYSKVYMVSGRDAPSLDCERLDFFFTMAGPMSENHIAASSVMERCPWYEYGAVRPERLGR
jgi:hypothetical protein